MVTYRAFLFCWKRLPWSDTGRHERSRKREGWPFIKKGRQKIDRFINVPSVTACVSTSKLTLLTARMIAPTSAHIHGRVWHFEHTALSKLFARSLARYSRVISIRARALFMRNVSFTLCHASVWLCNDRKYYEVAYETTVATITRAARRYDDR